MQPDFTTTLITGDRVLLAADLGLPFGPAIRHGFVFRLNEVDGQRLYTCSLGGRMMTLKRSELHRLGGPGADACAIAKALLRACTQPPSSELIRTPDDIAA